MGGATQPSATIQWRKFCGDRARVMDLKRIRPRSGKGKCNLSMWRIGISDAETLLRWLGDVSRGRRNAC
jgi:hypothetical protein